MTAVDAVSPSVHGSIHELAPHTTQQRPPNQIDRYGTPLFNRPLRHPAKRAVATACARSDAYVEGFFRNLDQKRLKRDAFGSVPHLIDAIMDYIDNHNDDPKPIVWTKAADDILEKVGRARATLDKSATQ